MRRARSGLSNAVFIIIIALLLVELLGVKVGKFKNILRFAKSVTKLSLIRLSFIPRALQFK